MDEYIKYVLTSSSELVPEDVRASSVRSLFRLLKKGSKNLSKYGIEYSDGKIVLEGSAIVKEDYISDGFDKIAKGLYFHHSDGTKKVKWKPHVFPFFLEEEETPPYDVSLHWRNVRDLVFYDLKNQKLLGEMQNIFAYQVHEDLKYIIVNMIFYRDRVISVWYSPDYS